MSYSFPKMVGDTSHVDDECLWQQINSRPPDWQMSGTRFAAETLFVPV
jgi:hypothetical protein